MIVLSPGRRFFSNSSTSSLLSTCSATLMYSFTFSHDLTIFLTSLWSNTSSNCEVPFKIPAEENKVCLVGVSGGCVRWVCQVGVSGECVRWVCQPLDPLRRSLLLLIDSAFSLNPSAALTSCSQAICTVSKVGGISLIITSSLEVERLCFPTYTSLHTSLL